MRATLVGLVFVGDPNLETIAQRLASFSGPMQARDDGALMSMTGGVVVMPNARSRDEPDGYASVVVVQLGDTDDESAENTMEVFRLLIARGDRRACATRGGQTIATFEPRLTPPLH